MFSSRSVIAAIISGIALVGVAAGIRAGQIEDAIADPAPHLILEATAPAVSALPKLTAPLVPPIPGADKAAAPVSVAVSDLLPAELGAAPAVPAGTITAEAYIVGDLDTGKIYLDKNPSLPLPIASMTKLVTAIDAIGTYSSSTPIAVTAAETEVPPDASDLQAGERFTLGELLYPLLLDSSNVAAEAIASSTDRAAFMRSMASYAKEMGMPESSFADPSGLSEDNVGSPRDFLSLATYLYHSRPDILIISRTVTSSLASTTDHGAHTFVNIHPFASDPRFLGGKTGYTYAALDDMLTMLTLDGRPIAIVVLHSLDRAKDTYALIDKVSADLSGS